MFGICALLIKCSRKILRVLDFFRFSYPMVLAVWVIESLGIKSTWWDFLQKICWSFEELPELGGGIAAARKTARAPHYGDPEVEVTEKEDLLIALGR